MNFIIASAMVFVALAQVQPSYGDQLRSAALKRTICDALPSLRLQIELSSGQCANGQFEVEQVLKDTVGGREVNTLMRIAVNVQQTTFKATLKRQVVINELGKLTLTPGWIATLQADQSASHVSAIEGARIGHSNVIPVAASRRYRLPLAIRDWHYNCERVGFDCSGFEYYEIYRLSDMSEVIGYLVIERASSDEHGEDYIVEAKFDVRGNQVGEISEGSIGH